MKTRKSLFWLLALLLLVLPLTAACENRITRNNDGSLDIQTTVTQTELQSAIQASLADPLIQSLEVTLRSGYIDVSGTRQRLNDSSKTDTLSFRLDLSVSDGHLTASISNAQIDGVAVEQTRVDVWNQTIANRLENLARRRPNTALQTVNITPDSLAMTWKVTK